MPAIAIRTFEGARPRIHERELSANEAAVAENCKLWNTKLKSWQVPNDIVAVSQNLLTFVEQPDHADWLKGNVTIENIDTIVAPDGTTTAERVQETAVTDNFYIREIITKSAAESQYFMVAVHVKVQERDHIQIRLSGVTLGDRVQATFDCVNKVVINNSTLGSGWEFISAKVTQIDSNWNRCILFCKSDAHTTCQLRYLIYNAAASYAGDTGSGLSMWGMQLAETQVEVPYRKTEANPFELARSIYLWKNQFWFRWDGDVDVARGPIAGDTSERTYYTSDNDAPRYTFDPLALTGSGDEYPLDDYLLGVPVPTAAPDVLVVPLTAAITNVTNRLGGSTGTSTPHVLSGIVTDGDSVTVSCKFKLTVAGEFRESGVATFKVSRDGGKGEIGSSNVDFLIDGTAGEIAFARPEFTLEVQDHPPAGTYAYTFEITHTLSNTPSTELFDFNCHVRSNKATVKSVAHGLDVGQLVDITNVLGFENINQEDLEIVEIVDADNFMVQVFSGQTYISGGTWSQDFKEQDLQESAWVYTYLSTAAGKDQEGPPSVASEIIAIGAGERVDLTNILDAPAGDYLITAKRIYRSNVGTDGSAAFQFVAEIGPTVTVYTDTTKPQDLGETIVSTEWDPPPADMQGLIEIHEAVLAGFSKNELIFSEPNQPHAYPDKYRLTATYDIVAIANFGSSVFIGTQGTPYVATGVHPESMSLERIEVIQPCLSKRSMVDMGYTVLYAAPNGLAYVSSGQIIIATETHFTQTEWQELNPPSMMAARYDDRYVCFFTKVNGTKGGFVFDPKERDSALTFLDFGADEAWTDPRTGDLYIVLNGFIAQFDAGASAQDYRWRSKIFSMNRHINMGAGLIQATSYPVYFTLLANKDPDVEDMVVTKNKTVQDAQPFRLPDGYLADQWQFEVSGNNEVTGVYIAPDMDELRRLL